MYGPKKPYKCLFGPTAPSGAAVAALTLAAVAALTAPKRAKAAWLCGTALRRRLYVSVLAPSPHACLC